MTNQLNDSEQYSARMDMMLKIKDYWTTSNGEPELSAFADYMVGLVTAAEMAIWQRVRHEWGGYSADSAYAKEPFVVIPVSDIEAELAQRAGSPKPLEYPKATGCICKHDATVHNAEGCQYPYCWCKGDKGE